MKSTLCIFIFSLLCISLNAQKIDGDKILSDGSRYIYTTNKYTGGFSDKVPISYFLAVTKHESKEDVWNLGLEVQAMYPLDLKEGTTFLMKTRSSNKTITLQTLISYKDIIGTYNDLAKVRLYKVYPTFTISKQDLDILLTEGVSKVRLELSSEEKGYLDKEYSKEKVSKILNDEYKLILNRIKETPLRKNISDGF